MMTIIYHVTAFDIVNIYVCGYISVLYCQRPVLFLAQLAELFIEALYMLIV